MLLFWGAVVAAFLVALFEPRVARGVERLDEREVMLRSCHLLAALMTLACFYGAYAAIGC